MGSIFTELIQAMTNAFTSIIGVLPGGIAGGLKDLLTITTGTGSDAVTSVSIFGYLVFTLAGIALAWGCVRFLVGLVRRVRAR